MVRPVGGCWLIRPVGAVDYNVIGWLLNNRPVGGCLIIRPVGGC